jgi:hypothetical protein
VSIYNSRRVKRTVSLLMIIEQSMERSLWYAPCNLHFTVFAASKTTYIRNLRYSRRQPRHHSSGLHGAIAILSSLWSDPRPTIQRSDADNLCSSSCRLCHADHVAGCRGQLFQRRPQTQVGLRQPGCHGTDDQKAAIERQCFSLANLLLSGPTGELR